MHDSLTIDRPELRDKKWIAISDKSMLSLFIARFFHIRKGIIGSTIVIACLLGSVLVPAVFGLDPLEMFRGHELQPPSQQHILGTDEFGRDIFARCLAGLKVSLLVAIMSMAVAGIPGIFTGIIAGYFGGMADTSIMRLWDGLLAFPTILLAIALAAVLGPGPINAALALGIVALPQFSRIARSGAILEKNKEYVFAARSIGASDIRIMLKHILPNVLPMIFVQATVSMGFAVLLEAGLSFLGLGTQPPYPSLGNMLSQSRKYLYTSWWYALYPGIAIAIVILGIYWVSDALSQAIGGRSLIKT
jgi:peptide/nickel transport system permease protein